MKKKAICRVPENEIKLIEDIENHIHNEDYYTNTNKISLITYNYNMTIKIYGLFLDHISYEIGYNQYEFLFDNYKVLGQQSWENWFLIDEDLEKYYASI